jgi:hypothetical protein
MLAVSPRHLSVTESSVALPLNKPDIRHRSFHHGQDLAHCRQVLAETTDPTKPEVVSTLIADQRADVNAPTAMTPTGGRHGPHINIPCVRRDLRSRLRYDRGVLVCREVAGRERTARLNRATENRKPCPPLPATAGARSRTPELHAAEG